MFINGHEVNVDTVMVKDVPAYEPSAELLERLDREARELLPKYSDHFINGYGLASIFRRHGLSG